MYGSFGKNISAAIKFWCGYVYGRNLAKAVKFFQSTNSTSVKM